MLTTGCTTVYEGGKPVLWTMADATNVCFKTARGTEFSADVLIHSRAIDAVSNGAAKVLLPTAAGGILIP